LPSHFRCSNSTRPKPYGTWCGRRRAHEAKEAELDAAEPEIDHNPSLTVLAASAAHISRCLPRPRSSRRVARCRRRSCAGEHASALDNPTSYDTGERSVAAPSVGAPSQMLLGTKRGLPRFWCRENSAEGHAGTSRENCHVQDRRHSSGEVALTTRGVGSRRICNTVLASGLADTGQRPNGKGSEAGNGSLCLDD
jgi:hypothetical protein